MNFNLVHKYVVNKAQKGPRKVRQFFQNAIVQVQSFPIPITLKGVGKKEQIFLKKSNKNNNDNSNSNNYINNTVFAKFAK